MMQEDLDISRGTLKEYEILLKKWNQKINLVSKSTLDDFEQRHLMDSVQITGNIDSKQDKIIESVNELFKLGINPFYENKSHCFPLALPLG